MNTTDQLKKDFDAAVEATGLAPSTIGMLAGYSGKLYQNICNGQRMWPETVEAIRANIAKLVEERQA